MDYPRSDRHLLEGVRRLTRIESKSVEQVVSLDGTDDLYNYPTLYAVEVGHWKLKESDAKQLREFLLRGGFLMVDDFHGERAADHDQGINEWANFKEGMFQIFPDRPIVDLPNDDPIFHTIFDLSDRFQVPGAQYFESGITYEKGPTGKVPHWRGVRDDKGRIMVAICHNMDLGDAWEHSDEAKYLEKMGVAGVPHRDELLHLRPYPLILIDYSAQAPWYRSLFRRRHAFSNAKHYSSARTLRASNTARSVTAPKVVDDYFG